MRHFSRGFTLIELLVVVAIIGILSAVGVVSYSGYKASAEMKKAEISLNTIYLAEQEYKSNNGSYYYNSSVSNIVTNLFDGVDDLSEQKYNFTISGNANNDTLSIVARNSSSGCQLTLNEKKKLTKSSC
jgi:type IV pilus assembly protein PilA